MIDCVYYSTRRWGIKCQTCAQGGGRKLDQMSKLGTFIAPQASIFYPINNDKLVVLSVEDHVKHPDREINSAADKVYLTVQCNTRKNK